MILKYSASDQFTQKHFVVLFIEIMHMMNGNIVVDMDMAPILVIFLIIISRFLLYFVNY